MHFKRSSFSSILQSNIFTFYTIRKLDIILRRLFLLIFLTGFAAFAQAQERPFITTWKTTTAAESITIPTHIYSLYSYTVDWGDGSSDPTVYTGNATHQYTTAGTYTVSISGEFPSIHFNNSGDKNKIYTIEQWGTIAWKSMSHVFYGCSNLKLSDTISDVPDLSNVSRMNSAFREATSFTGDLSTWDVSNVTEMNNLFRNATSFNSDLSGWEVSQITDMQQMFNGATSFNSDLSDWDVSNVTNMIRMFHNALSFNGDVSGWDVSNVTNMSSLFFSALSFNQNLGFWDLSSVTSANAVISNTGFSASNYDATLIGWADDNGGTETIPSGVALNTYGLTYCNGADARASLINDYNWTISNDSEACDPFVTTWETTAVDESITIPTTTADGEVYSYTVDWGDGSSDATVYTGDATHEYTTAGTYTVSITGEFPRIYFNDTGDADKILTVESWGTNVWSSMAMAFSGCSNLTNVPVDDAPYLAEVTSMEDMFEYATSFDGDLNSWDVSQVTNMYRTFTGATSFNGDISRWDVSNVTNMGFMFTDAASFNQDIGDWDVSHVTNLEWMLYGTSAFDFSLGAWDLSEATEIGGMLGNSGLSTSSYDATLNGWADDNGGTETIPDGLTLSAFGLKYSCEGADARASLISEYGWAVIDAGQIADVIDPVADLETLADIESECDVESLTAPTATDNCSGSVSGTHDASLPITESTTITWTYTDESNNSITQTQEVIIADITAPEPDVDALANVEAQCSVESLTPPSATDNCSGTVTVTHDATLPITESTTITWTYTDESDNASTQTQEVVIDDTTAPEADEEVLANLEDQCSVVTLTAPTATDNCSGTVTVTHDATLPITESTTVTWTYTDESDNVSTQTQEVLIEDKTVPEADEETLTNIESQCAIESLTAPTATDNCSGTVTVTHDATLPITESTTVTWSYTDESENTST
ncbi:BspA family leucine-rich repeat surface protein, partial [Reichenbachiella agariperforans]|uniref:BspA family leucine-rich repeat surface protein n=1 Tax=Reichenbachiella agariperforans TaxID=156994 RepID=UPI001C080EDA